MNSVQLYKYNYIGANRIRQRPTDFIPQLSTGTMPPSQASAVADSLPANAQVNGQAIPFPPGASSSGALPKQVNIQNTRGTAILSLPPWVLVPQCNTKVIPKSRGLGLIPNAGTVLNLPAKQGPARSVFSLLNKPEQLTQY